MTEQNLKVKKLNEDSYYRTFDPIKLKQELQLYKHSKQLIEELIHKKPNLFSSTVFFMGDYDLNKIEKLIKIIDKVLKSNSKAKYHESSGVFMGFDFHLTEKGPQLIEINTNAGGPFLNIELAKAQNQFNRSLLQVQESFFQMFVNEWQIQRGDQDLKVAAIVDERPEQQFLYPEFLLFQEMMESKGVKCFICDSSSLINRDDGLYFENYKIDLVYNRLTDFYLTDQKSKAILNAYHDNTIVVTPSPFHFETYANKKKLAQLSSTEYLKSIGVRAEEIEVLLGHIPQTTIISSSNQAELWNNRKHYFFKPIIGYGSKATYRGDKLTTRVWEEIRQSDYVAQKIAPPSIRTIIHEDQKIQAKVDLRAYVYDGKIQLLAARLYSGQTTNFRTPGGGFAPVVVVS